MASAGKSKPQRRPTKHRVGKGNTGRVLGSVQSHIQSLEHKFKGLLEAVPDAMVMVDRTGRIVPVNLRMGDLFGKWPKQELLRFSVKNMRQTVRTV